VGLALLVGVGSFAAFRPQSEPTPDLPLVQVWRSPTCGCCHLWVQHLEEEGFDVEVNDVMDMATVKREHGVPGHLQSCHTALVDGYLVEGHVPAADMKRLLTERPEVAGISVPGMPVGSPGMEQGDEREPYSVFAFQKDGSYGVFQSHR
jgi:hypothetical protein